MKVIWKKKETTNDDVRRCLNCGKDISDKKRGAKFCSIQCYQGYYNMEKPFIERSK